MGVSIKRFLPSSLFGRTLLILVAPIILLQLAAAVVFFDRHWIKITERLSYAVAGELAAISEQIETHQGDKEIVDVISQIMATHLEILMSYVPNETLDNPMTDLSGQTVSAYLARALDDQVRRPFSIDVTHQNKRVDVWIELEGGVLQVTMPERRLYSSSGYIFILWLIGLSFFFFAISVILMRNQIRPILRLAIAANRLGKGRDVSFFKPTGAREVRQAAEAFLKMRDRIRRQIEQRTAMLAGVSHDLRTPITRMKLQLEMMDDGTCPDIKDMKADLHEMEVMVDAYLAFARGEDDEQTQAVDLNAMLRDIITKFTRDGRQITADLVFKGDVGLRRNQMERAIGNIIGNAVKFADHVTVKGWLDTESEDASAEAVIEIRDDGPGIPVDEMENVFRPFYRLEGSRNKKSGGVGLGLSIAQDIINAHGGSVALSENLDAPHGLLVTIRLPL